MIVISINRLITERNDEQFDFCSTQVNLADVADIVSYAVKNIKLGDLHEYGIEREPHVTVLYGIESEAYLPALKKVCSKIKPFSIKLGSVSLFETDPSFDVLKIDIISPELHKLNSLFKSNSKFHSDFPDYHPHLTLAYLKKGKGKSYLGLNKFEGHIEGLVANQL